jgi:hypothetical protein
MVWDGTFSPVGPNKRPKKLSTDPEKPDKVETPPAGLPAIADLEVWRGDDKFIHQAWSLDGVTYLTVHFDHRDVCYIGEDAPSNFIPYVYLYDENDLEDLASGEFSEEQFNEIFS